MTKEVAIQYLKSNRLKEVFPGLADAVDVAIKALTESETREIPPIEELYKAIPFPEDEKEAAFFVAGIAEAHKFLTKGTP